MCGDGQEPQRKARLSAGVKSRLYSQPGPGGGFECKRLISSVGECEGAAHHQLLGAPGHPAPDTPAVGGFPISQNPLVIGSSAILLSVKS
jgi:hypothetical protein